MLYEVAINKQTKREKKETKLIMHFVSLGEHYFRKLDTAFKKQKQ